MLWTIHHNSVPLKGCLLVEVHAPQAIGGRHRKRGDARRVWVTLAAVLLTPAMGQGGSYDTIVVVGVNGCLHSNCF